MVLLCWLPLFLVLLDISYALAKHCLTFSRLLSNPPILLYTQKLLRLYQLETCTCQMITFLNCNSFLSFRFQKGQSILSYPRYLASPKSSYSSRIIEVISLQLTWQNDFQFEISRIFLRRHSISHLFLFRCYRLRFT